MEDVSAPEVAAAVVDTMIYPTEVTCRFYFLLYFFLPRSQFVSLGFIRFTLAVVVRDKDKVCSTFRQLRTITYGCLLAECVQAIPCVFSKERHRFDGQEALVSPQNLQIDSPPGLRRPPPTHRVLS